MNKSTTAARQQPVPEIIVSARREVVVRLMLRCTHCRQKSLAVGKSSGDLHSCKFCGARVIVR